MANDDLSDRQRIIRFRESAQTVPQPLVCSPFVAGMAPCLTHLDVAARTIRLQFEPGAEYVAARGALQGGAVATMLDLTMVFLILALVQDDASTSTAGLNISYLAPARPGRYGAEGAIERIGRTMGFARASLISGDRTVATATGLFPIFRA